MHDATSAGWLRVALLALGVGSAIALGCPVASADPGDQHRGPDAGPRSPRGVPVSALSLPATRRVPFQRASAAAPAVSIRSAAAVGAGSATSGRAPVAPAAVVSVRPLRSLLFNQTPSLSPVVTSQSPTGVVIGELNAADADSSTLSYSVVGAPTHGSVSVDGAGRYTYTADPTMAVAGYTDSFTVSVSDAGSGFHLHGLGGLLSMLTFGLLGDPGHARTTTVGVVVAPLGPSPYPLSVERQIYATQTDANITAAPGAGEAPHVVINPSPLVTPQGQLVVFLPGTQGRPTQYAYILRAAASLGFYAVGLNYPNQTAMGSLCRNSADSNCYWTARNEVLWGNVPPVPGQSDVTEADSIVNRLNKLLVWMNATYPDEGWGQFLGNDDTVDWGKVVVAGHSQGGGYAGVLAKEVLLSRAVYFSSPDDWNELANQPANWTSKPNVTPPDRQYGFGSDADSLVPNSHAVAHWDSLGLYRPAAGPVLVDNAGPPFSGSHQLITSLAYNPASTAPTVGLKNHGITVVDTSTPVDGAGKPLFAVNGVWSYLL